MEDPLDNLGPKIIIKKHEFVRVIIQCLYSLGYRKSPMCLESESGIGYKSDEFETLETHIRDANWDACIDNLNRLNGLTNETRASALFLVVKQCLLEYLNRGDDSSALEILRKKISGLEVGKDKVHRLAFGLLSFKELGLDKVDPDVIYNFQKKLLIELEKVLPPPITLPDRRLEYLVEMAVWSQIDSCVFHNSVDAISLYEDHHCDGNQFPTKTIQILTTIEMKSGMSSSRTMEATWPHHQVTARPSYGRWGCLPGQYQLKFDAEETRYLLRGKVTVYPKNTTETSVEFGAGDLVIISKGLSCTWDVFVAVDKHYKFDSSSPS